MKTTRSIFFILVIFAVTIPAWAQAVSSTELINNARHYDGKNVIYEGEAIGEVMLRGQYAWVNVNDGANAIGIWVNKDLAREISNLGSYRAKGDWVAVAGVFNRSCPSHGGDLDIHAQELRRTIPGKIMRERLNTTKRNLATVLLGLLCLILILPLSRRT